jgi:hypothetical protein
MAEVVTSRNGTKGVVSVRGKDGQPLVELLGRDNESVIGVGSPMTVAPARRRVQRLIAPLASA